MHLVKYKKQAGLENILFCLLHFVGSYRESIHLYLRHYLREILLSFEIFPVFIKLSDN